MNRIKFVDKHCQKQRHYYTPAETRATTFIVARLRELWWCFCLGAPNGELTQTAGRSRRNSSSIRHCCILPEDSLRLINILRFAYLSGANHGNSKLLSLGRGHGPRRRNLPTGSGRRLFMDVYPILCARKPKRGQ